MMLISLKTFCSLLRTSFVHILSYLSFNVLYFYAIVSGLLKLLICPNSFFCRFHQIFLHRWLCSMQINGFPSSFLTCMPFIYFSHFISLIRPFSTMWNKHGESEHPCLLPNLRGKHCLSQVSVLWAVDFS